MAVFDRIEPGQRFENAVALGLERVGAQIQRGATGHVLAFGDPVVIEGALQRWCEPFGDVSEDVAGRGVGELADGAGFLFVGQRCGSMTVGGEAVAELGRVHVPIAHRDRQDQSPWAVAAHECGMRGAAAEGVVDEVADGGPIPCSGEAVVKPPGLERLGHGALAGLDIGQDFDRGGQAARQAHQTLGARTTRRSTSHSQKMANTARPAV
jgi:hypothetical protein